jgi:hypothetical protein
LRPVAEVMQLEASSVPRLPIWLCGIGTEYRSVAGIGYGWVEWWLACWCLVLKELRVLNTTTFVEPLSAQAKCVGSGLKSSYVTNEYCNHST